MREWYWENEEGFPRLFPPLLHRESTHCLLVQMPFTRCFQVGIWGRQARRRLQEYIMKRGGTSLQSHKHKHVNTPALSLTPTHHLRLFFFFKYIRELNSMPWAWNHWVKADNQMILWVFIDIFLALTSLEKWEVWGNQTLCPMSLSAHKMYFCLFISPLYSFNSMDRKTNDVWWVRLETGAANSLWCVCLQTPCVLLSPSVRELTEVYHWRGIMVGRGWRGGTEWKPFWLWVQTVLYNHVNH